MKLIGTQNGTGSSAVISFTSLGAYTHLYVVGTGSLTGTGTIYVRPNDNSVSQNYFQNFASASVGQGTTAEGGLANALQAVGWKVGSLNEWDFEMFFFDYRGDKKKNAQINSGNRTGNQEILYGGGYLDITSAITSLYIYSTFNFTTTTTISVYGF
jgi:hypothetical protein